MFCIKCGKEIEDNSTFCKFCGAAVSNAGNGAAGAPQSVQPGAFQPMAGGFSLNLAPNIVDMINKLLRGAIAIVGLLVLIGSIGTLGTTSSAMSNLYAGLNTLRALYNFMVLMRVASIIAFSLTIAGCVFTILTKQRSLFSYISAGIGTLIFIFHFIVFGAGSFGVVVVFCIFLILLSIALIGASVIIIMNKENIVNFKPKF